MASNASLMVTPLRFLAVTSSPSGKCRSIFLTGGVVSSFLRMSFSSTVDGDVFIFLRGGQTCGLMTTMERPDLPPCRLCLLCDLQFNPLGLCIAGVSHYENCRMLRGVLSYTEEGRQRDLPRSLMFMTPLALELARRCLVSLGGGSMPWTAESTLVSGSDMLSFVWCAESGFDQAIGESLQRTDSSEQPDSTPRQQEAETERRRAIDAIFLPFARLKTDLVQRSIGRRMVRDVVVRQRKM